MQTEFYNSLGLNYNLMKVNISQPYKCKILLTLKYAWHSQQGGVICSSFRVQLIIDIKYVNKQTNKIYINKQTNNIYINKQITAKAEFNKNFIKNFTNMKAIFKNILHNLIQNITNLKICITNKEVLSAQALGTNRLLIWIM